ncbi:MAG: hypothetical protein QW548_02405 [Candidatus Aenigmatarchaeota archaeon]
MGDNEIPKLLEMFYKPQNADDFGAVVRLLDDYGQTASVLQFVQVAPLHVPPNVADKIQARQLPPGYILGRTAHGNLGLVDSMQVIADARGEISADMVRAAISQRPQKLPISQVILGDATRGYVLVDGGWIANVLSDFEAMYSDLKPMGRGRRLGVIMNPFWKYSEVRQRAVNVSAETPSIRPIALAYLIELYDRINYPESTDRWSERFDAYTKAGLDDMSAMALIAKEYGFNIGVVQSVVLDKSFESNPIVQTLGLANRLFRAENYPFGSKLYRALPAVCGRVIGKLAAMPQALEKIWPQSAMDAYLVAGAGEEACGRYIEALAKGPNSKHEQLTEIVKEYSEIAEPDLEAYRARICEAVA